MTIYKVDFTNNIVDRARGRARWVFLWGNWISSDDTWLGSWVVRRSHAIRDKPAEEVVRSAYAG